MANFITLARIALIIPFVLVFMANAPWNMNIALIIFAVAALTDFLDGYVARARNETSALGAALDPIADKLLIAAAFILLVRNGVITGPGVIAVIVIISRELVVSGLREALGARNATLRVTSLAKWKTTLQLIAAGLLMAAAPTGVLGDNIRPLASGALWGAAILTLWTGATYCLGAMRILRTDQP